MQALSKAKQGDMASLSEKLQLGPMDNLLINHKPLRYVSLFFGVGVRLLRAVGVIEE